MAQDEARHAATNTVRFADVAARIDATTVHFTSLTDPEGTSVLEQNFEYDLVSADKILSKHVDRPITVELENGATVAGTLLSFDAAQIVVQAAAPPEPLQIVQRAGNVRNIRFSALPGGLITKPTLVWQIDAKKEGEHLAKVAYQTDGMSWNADYTVVAAPDDKAVDLAAWVTITNQSGASYKDAELKLVAGDVNRVVAPSGPVIYGAQAEEARAAAAQTRGSRRSRSSSTTSTRSVGRRRSPTTRRSRSSSSRARRACRRRRSTSTTAASGSSPTADQPYFDRNYGITSNRKVDIYVEFRQRQGARGSGFRSPPGASASTSATRRTARSSSSARTRSTTRPRTRRCG